jgi:hypothetical protein
MCRRGIWVEARIGIVEARVLAIGDLAMVFLGQLWHTVAKAEDEFHRLVVGNEVVEFGNAA